jgi:uncharacterized protein YbjT (DUF2867 family)
MTRVLIAGASGYLGRHVVSEFASRGYETRALIRDPGKRHLVEAADETVVLDLLDPGDLPERLLGGVDIVFSAAGQPCTLQRIADRESFGAVDYPINRALLDAALRSGARKFVYVTVLAPPRMREDAYVAAHERFVEELAVSGIDYTVIGANGFFYSYLDLLDVVRRGMAVSLSDGKARSNPIHEADLAIACVEATEGKERRVEVGGPEVITRREEIEIAFAAVGRKPRVLRVPRALLGAVLPFLRLGDRRRAEMLAFLARLSSDDVLAPPHGERRLREYLAEHS